ncbi:Alpha/Beta hydrolase protein [Stachybotrys elegans]|uniref:Alpha/Beta hydrolase protein n=1 Tax=Stachybotrys elegans TaxID=80388 RepID=A0A8K0WKM6_9HYPO|nr:Alpha/Beta hydrolase protein [Stachybotrys elegans]
MSQTGTPAVVPRGSFGETYIVGPKTQHTHTAILLHGRGSDGAEFADELFSTRISDGSTFPQKLPGWKWVFPSSQRLWSTTFQEEIPAWFEAHSLTDIAVRQDLQISGLRGSAEHVGNIVDQEIASLKGGKDNVIIIGISQGAATGLWTLLSSSSLSAKVGAFIGASSWLPFADDLKYNFSQISRTGEVDSSSATNGVALIQVVSPVRSSSLNATPVFLGHGIDDAYVDVELGRQARDALTSIGLEVEWKEYEGAEQEGHWFKEPEEIDDIFQFIQRVILNAKAL